ncbi:MAG: hypothetical protein WCF85_14010 [Rhodospirillaceae bacterium]
MMTELTAGYDSPFLRSRDQPLDQVARILLTGWRLVVLCALSAGLLAVGGLRLVPPEHSASMVIGPIARSGASAMGVRAPGSARPDSLLSVVEFGSGDEILSDYTRFLELLTSPAIAARLQQEPGLVQHLFPDHWNSAGGRWQLPDSAVGRLRGMVLALVGRDDWAEPDAEIVSRQLRRMVVIQPLGANPMRRLTVRDADRSFALRLLDRMVAAADGHLRAEALRRAETSAAFVRARLAATAANDDRAALADLRNDLERVSMMLRVELPFAADPIEPPSAAQQPDWPNPQLILPLAVAAGTGLGLFLVFARAAGRGPWVRKRTKSGGPGWGI